MNPTQEKIKIIRIDEVVERTTLSKSSIYRRLKTEKANPIFPRPRRLSLKRIVWREDEIENFMKNLATQ